MGTSIGRSLRVPCFLLGCLALSVVGGRAEEPAGTAQATTPPVPSKQTPATPPVPSKQTPATTGPCDACPPAFPGKRTVNLSFPSKHWKDGMPFEAHLAFTNQTDYFNFKNSTFAYLCFTPPGSSPPRGAWRLISGSGVFDDPHMKCSVKFMACDPLRGTPIEDAHRVATGTGRIIVTSDATVGVHDQYQAGEPFDGLAQQL